MLYAVNKTEKGEEVAPEVSLQSYSDLRFSYLSAWTFGFFVFNWFTCEQIVASAKAVQEKKEIYTPYNILPLDSAGASQSIMQLEEVPVYVSFIYSSTIYISLTHSHRDCSSNFTDSGCCGCTVEYSWLELAFVLWATKAENRKFGSSRLVRWHVWLSGKIPAYPTISYALRERWRCRVKL